MHRGKFLRAETLKFSKSYQGKFTGFTVGLGNLKVPSMHCFGSILFGLAVVIDLIHDGA